MIVFFDKWKIFSEFLKVKYIYLKNHTTIVTSCNSKVKYNNINYNNFNFDGIIKVTTCNITCKQETKVCWEIIEAHPSPKQECVGGTAVWAGGCAVYIWVCLYPNKGVLGPVYSLTRVSTRNQSSMGRNGDVSDLNSCSDFLTKKIITNKLYLLFTYSQFVNFIIKLQIYLYMLFSNWNCNYTCWYEVVIMWYSPVFWSSD